MFVTFLVLLYIDRLTDISINRASPTIDYMVYVLPGLSVTWSMFSGVYRLHGLCVTWSIRYMVYVLPVL